VFGYLDSQALFSSFSNVRLDGYVYTIQSLRNAWNKLNDDGVLALSFATSGHRWLGDKLVATVTKATGRTPLVYFDGQNIVVLAARKALDAVPLSIGKFQQLKVVAEKLPPVPTDDWPFLYLSKRIIPFDYLVVIAALLLMSSVGVMVLRPRGNDARGSVHFFLLGLGFLLLQTNSISAATLYFGTTWSVTTVIVAGVLLMVLLANTIASRFLRNFSAWLYLPLLAALLVLYLTPSEFVLSLPALARFAWAAVVMPLPIFFAGLIFSTTFRTSNNPAASFGANLLGATVGGFVEYGSMIVGHRSLFLVVIAAYLGSLLNISRPARHRDTAILAT
jgi:hypothetical protein